MSVLETYFKLPHHFGVALSALSGHFATTIAGIPVTISLPKVKWSGDGDWVRADLIAPDWDHVPDDNHWDKTLETSWPWGSVSNYRPGDRAIGTAWVSHFRVSTNCADDDDEAQARATALLDSLEGWWPPVCDWIEVLTGQVHRVPSRTLVLGNHHPAWTEVKGAKRRLFSKSDAVVEVAALTGGPNAVTAELFQAALDQALQEPPPTEWLLIRDGRVAHHSGSTRRAVIDAGTATELAITKLIEDQLDGTPENVIELLLAGHRMLGARLALLKKLGAGEAVPNETQEGLVKPRNVATHQGANLSGSEAHEALRIAAAIVGAAYPLASFN